ncbi:MAG TPA: helix-turn-helix domain-containing protein [Steroidobacteraceae bacterium]
MSEKLATLSPERRQRIESRANELIAEEMSLRELRRALGRTQVKVASDLGVGQDTVSRYEKRADMLLSTLQHYVSKMGGELVLIAEFPNRKPVKIKGLGEIAEHSGGRRSRTRVAA